MYSYFLKKEVPKAKSVFLNLNIRRSHLIEDSIREVNISLGATSTFISMVRSPYICTQLIHNRDNLKKKVKISFKGELGVDAGGLTKEWFLLLLREIFRPEYGMSRLSTNSRSLMHVAIILCCHVHAGLFTCCEDSEFFWFSSGLTGDHRYSEYQLVGLVSIN
jgi:E3 ubiquitin-protein ligase HECTD2